MRARTGLVVLAVLLVATGCRPEAVEAPQPPRPSPQESPTVPEDAAATRAPTEDGEAAVQELADEAWTRLSDAPAALTEVAAAAFAGQLWVAGGFDGRGDAVSSVWVYDPAFDAWNAGPPLPVAVHHAALVGGGDDLWLLGGYTGSGFDRPTAAVWRLDLATGGWVEGPALPSARAAGAAASDGQRVIYGGGVGPGGVAAEVWALGENSWSDVGALSVAREHLAATGDGEGSVWFLGGRAGGIDGVLGTVDVVRGGSVSAAGEVPTPRGGVAAFWSPQDGACLVGGEVQTGTFAEVECIRADGSVTVLPSLGVSRHGLGAAVLEGTAYVVMGGPEPGLTVSPAAEAWRVAPDGDG